MTRPYTHKKKRFNKSVSFEVVKKQCPYDLFITQTYKGLPKGGFKFQLEYTMVDLLKNLDEVGIFEAYPEFTLQGGIHWHIMLSLDNKFNYFKFLLPFLKRQGFTDIQYIKNYQALYDYVNKDITVTSKLVGYQLPFINRDRQIRFKHWRKLIGKYKKQINELKYELSLNYINKLIYNENYKENYNLDNIIQDSI